MKSEKNGKLAGQGTRHRLAKRLQKPETLEVGLRGEAGRRGHPMGSVRLGLHSEAQGLLASSKKNAIFLHVWKRGESTRVALLLWWLHQEPCVLGLGCRREEGSTDAHSRRAAVSREPSGCWGAQTREKEPGGKRAWGPDGPGVTVMLAAPPRRSGGPGISGAQLRVCQGLRGGCGHPMGRCQGSGLHQRRGGGSRGEHALLRGQRGPRPDLLWQVRTRFAASRTGEGHASP